MSLRSPSAKLLHNQRLLKPTTTTRALMVHLARDKELPEGVLQDLDGNPTTDPAQYFAGGMLRPLGGLMGYKGFGLSLLVEILAGVLSGAGCSNSEVYSSRPFMGVTASS